MITILNKVFGRLGLQVVPLVKTTPPDIESDPSFIRAYNVCKSFTMTSPERLFSLYHSIHYVVKNDIAGDFVECGVWKGGSSMMIAHVLKELGVTNRKIWMYDTYEGMSEPDEIDKDYSGKSAVSQLQAADKKNSNSVWCYSSLDEVKNNMETTGYPMNNIKFIKGKVEDSIPNEIPQAIALLRLDTDWYASTMHELIHLYPLLKEKGVLIIDDFGHWEGAKKAVLEYFQKNSLYPLLSRIDDTGRILLKI